MIYIMWVKWFKLWKVPAMVGSIVVIGIYIYIYRTHHALFHFICDLKAAQINMQWSLIQKFMFYKFELGDNVNETRKNNCCAKGNSDHVQ